MPSWLIRVAACAAVTTSQPDVAQLALEAAGADDEHAPDPGLVVAQIERGRAGRRDDSVGRRPGAPMPASRVDVVDPVVHRVVRDVHDVVAGLDARREDRGHARHRFRAAVDDAVEIDEQRSMARS